jgi:hypothetical protein
MCVSGRITPGFEFRSDCTFDKTSDSWRPMGTVTVYSSELNSRRSVTLENSRTKFNKAEWGMSRFRVVYCLGEKMCKRPGNPVSRSAEWYFGQADILFYRFSWNRIRVVGMVKLVQIYKYRCDVKQLFKNIKKNAKMQQKWIKSHISSDVAV